MKRPARGSTVKQYAYATRRLSPGKAQSKKELALLSGYSMTMAENVKAKVEDTQGYQNALVTLATDSNNLLVAVIAEFKSRGLTEFSNTDLIKALNAISGAWERIEKKREPNRLQTPEGNPLRAILQRRVETQTMTVEEIPAPAPTPIEHVDLDL